MSQPIEQQNSTGIKNTFGRQIEKCFVCGKSVYPMERISDGDKVYHKVCFKCSVCSAPLQPGKSNTINSTLLCGPHYYQELKKIGYDNSKTTLTKDGLKEVAMELMSIKLSQSDLLANKENSNSSSSTHSNHSSVREPSSSVTPSNPPSTSNDVPSNSNANPATSHSNSSTPSQLSPSSSASSVTSISSTEEKKSTPSVDINKQERPNLAPKPSKNWGRPLPRPPFTKPMNSVTPIHPPALPVIEEEIKIERPRDSVKVETASVQKKEGEVKRESPIQSLETQELKLVIPEPLVPEQHVKSKVPIEDETSSEDEAKEKSEDSEDDSEVLIPSAHNSMNANTSSPSTPIKERNSMNIPSNANKEETQSSSSSLAESPRISMPERVSIQITEMKFEANVKNTSIDRATRVAKFFGLVGSEALQSLFVGLDEDPIDLFVEKKEAAKYQKDMIRKMSNKEIVNLRKISLEERIRKKWLKTADKLPIAIDIPRLLRHIEIKTPDGDTLMTRQERALSVSGTQRPALRRKLIRNFLETLAIQLGDTKNTLPKVIQHFKVETDNPDENSNSSDLSVYMKMFIEEHMREETMTLRILKAVNQTIIAPAFVHLKNQFKAIGIAFFDIPGTWKISITIGSELSSSSSERVTVLHSKGAKSADTSPKGYFEFVWELYIEFDRSIQNMTRSYLSIPAFEFSEEFPKDKRKEIVKMLSTYDNKESPNDFEKKTIRPNKKRRETRGYHEIIRAGTLGERRFVDKLLNRTLPLYFQWGTSLIKEKTKDRLLVLGNYRVFIVRRNKMGKKKIVREAHLFDLIGLKSTDRDKVILYFRDFEFDFVSQAAGDIIPALIVTQYKKITYAFPKNRLRIEIDPVDRIGKIPSPPVPTDKGFLDTYKAYCEFLRSPINKTFCAFVDNLLAHNLNELPLHLCTGIETPNEDFSLELSPIAAALRFNPYFITLICRDVPRKDVLQKFAPIFEFNQAITTLIMSGIETEDGFIELGQALKRGKNSKLSAIDLSNNRMKDKGMFELSEGLRFCNYLTNINVSDNDLSSNGIIALFRALGSNGKITLRIQELNISRNECGTFGTSAITTWLSTYSKTEEDMDAPITLNYFNLSKTNLDVNNFSKSLRLSRYGDVIKILDLSQNKIDKSGANSLCQYLDSSESLKQLYVSGCSLNINSASSILSTIANNARIKGFKIDLSDNGLGDKGASLLYAILRNSHNIQTIVLQDNNFKKDGMLQIIKAITENQTLQHVDLGLNKVGKKCVDLVKAIGEALSKNSELKSLSLNGCQLGKELANAFSGITKLKYLDVTNNKMTDVGLIELSNVLKQNKSLTFIKFDRNDLTTTGFKAFQECLIVNNSLYEIALPEHDISKAIGSSRDMDKEFEIITQIMLEIKTKLKQNRPKITSVTSVSVASDINLAFRDSMEDEHQFIDKFGGNDRSAFIGVYDGHAGARVAGYLLDNLANSVLNELKKTPGNVKDALTRAYLNTDDDIGRLGFGRAGSTAVTALLIEFVNEKLQPTHRKLWVANVGDARAVLSRNGVAIRLSVDHKASDEKEQARITKMGSFVFNDRLGGTLAVSRAFGDHDLKKYGLISDPFISETTLLPTDNLLILACDGLWDVTSDQEAVDLIKGETDTDVMAEKLLRYALDQGTKDNVTVMVVAL